MTKAPAKKAPARKAKAPARKPAAKPETKPAAKPARATKAGATSKPTSKPTKRQAKQRANAAKARATRTAKAKERGLAEQQEMFCQEYLIDLNGRQAAIRAGYSAKTAAQQAARLLTNVKVISRIEELKKTRLERININADVVIQHLAAIATTHMGHVAAWDGERLVPFSSEDLTYAQMVAVRKVKMTKVIVDDVETSHTEVELRDNMRALQLLGQHFNVFNQKHNGLPKRAVLFNFGTNQREQNAGGDDQ